MVFKLCGKLLCVSNYVKSKVNVSMYRNVFLYHYSDESHEEMLPADWYEKAFPKMIKMSHLLKNVDLVDQKLVNIDDNSVFIDDHIEKEMNSFKTLVRTFIGSSHVQESMMRNMVDDKSKKAYNCFRKSSERHPAILNSLTKVCNFLNVSAQQRRVVRFTICPQVTQHRIWKETLEKLLNELKTEIDSLNFQESNKKIQMGDQIVSNCLKFLADPTDDPESASWMRLSPKKIGDLPTSQTWEDILEMFNHLIKCLKNESKLEFYVAKLEIMKEGLFHIRDVLVDKSIAFKEIRHQESLVQKKLSKTLGHSSKCLFTLLLYFLYGSVRDIDVDICGGVYKHGKTKENYLCLGRVLTSDAEKMVQNGVKNLDKALGLYKFVWEIAGMEGGLELQGHLWCVEAKERKLMYRGNMYFIHSISV